MRLIRLDGQICESVAEFAFYDTVRDAFVKIGDDWTWTCLDRLTESLEADPDRGVNLRERLTGLARSAGYPDHESGDDD